MKAMAEEKYLPLSPHPLTKHAVSSYEITNCNISLILFLILIRKGAAMKQRISSTFLHLFIFCRIKNGVQRLYNLNKQLSRHHGF